MNGRSRNFRISSGMLMTAALAVIITVSLFFLIRSGILYPDESSPENPAETSETLPDMESPESTGVIYYNGREMEPVQLLETLTESDSLVWNFRAIEAWEDAYTVERTNVSRRGEKYRIETDSRLVICDGETVYRREGMVEMTLPASETSFHAEAGLTPLETIQNGAADASAAYDDPGNIKYIKVTAHDGEIRSEYEISIETGIPVTERSYLGSAVYRMILTDSLSVFAADELPDDHFEIPEVH